MCRKIERNLCEKLFICKTKQKYNFFSITKLRMAMPYWKNHRDLIWSLKLCWHAWLWVYIFIGTANTCIVKTKNFQMFTNDKIFQNKQWLWRMMMIITSSATTCFVKLCLHHHWFVCGRSYAFAIYICISNKNYVKWKNIISGLFKIRTKNKMENIRCYYLRCLMRSESIISRK